MTRKQQLKLFDDFYKKAIEVMKSKGEDYAGEEDVLSNFKAAGGNIKLSAELQCLSLISTKVARLGTLLNSNKKPNNESILDSVLDLQIYAFLLSCLLTEEKTSDLFWKGRPITKQQKIAIDQIEQAGTFLFGSAKHAYVEDYILRTVINVK